MTLKMTKRSQTIEEIATVFKSGHRESQINKQVGHYRRSVNTILRKTRPRRTYHHRDAAPRRQRPERILIGGVIANVDGVRRIDAGVAHEELDRRALAADAARNRLVN